MATGTNSRASVMVNGTSYADSISNTAKHVTINSGAGNDTIVNAGLRCSINAGDGNDFVANNNRTYATIDTGAGNDTVKNGYKGSYGYGASALINTGIGNDSIYNFSTGVTIKAGAGNDWIENWSYYSVINAGTGDDTIAMLNTSLHDNLIIYRVGDGNDRISNLGINNTIAIADSTYSTATSNSDMIITVGKGKITLVGGANRRPQIVGPYATINGGSSTPHDKRRQYFDDKFK